MKNAWIVALVIAGFGCVLGGGDEEHADAGPTDGGRPRLFACHCNYVEPCISSDIICAMRPTMSVMIDSGTFCTNSRDEALAQMTPPPECADGGLTCGCRCLTAWGRWCGEDAGTDGGEWDF